MPIAWKWIAAGAVSVLLLGCAPSILSGGILAGAPRGSFGPNGVIGCFTSAADGLLVVDPAYGTAIIQANGPDSVRSIVAWLPGFTARKLGPEVEVLDPEGKVVATTGRRYRLDGGSVLPDQWPGLPTPVFWACDRVIPES